MRTPALLVAAAAALTVAGVAHAGTPSSPSSSTNWAGYAVSGATFTDVKGTWVQPAVTCPAGSTYAAFWVGLGGFLGGGGNGGLEQIGTDSDCLFGSPAYSAWYELLPDVSIPVPIPISAGDTVSAEVSTDLASATLTLTDVTTGASFTTSQTPTLLDATSAEWIAEAPSQCFGTDHCVPLTLANFGTISFSGSSTTASGHVGTISDASWATSTIALGGKSGVAAPAALSPDGSGFSVSYTPSVQQQPAKAAKARARPRHRHRRSGGTR